jgi:hypothetical protein
MRCTGAQCLIYHSHVYKIKNLYRNTSSYMQQLEDMEKKSTDRRDNTMSIGMLRACIHLATCKFNIIILICVMKINVLTNTADSGLDVASRFSSRSNSVSQRSIFLTNSQGK